jgi:predicted DNA-binding protein (MmcQ/YjbR family)
MLSENLILQRRIRIGEAGFMVRSDLESFILETYNAQTDHPFRSYPNYQVIRHSSNRKWFALVMDIPKSKLGLHGDEILDVVNF